MLELLKLVINFKPKIRLIITETGKLLSCLFLTKAFINFLINMNTISAKSLKEVKEQWRSSG